MDESWRLVRQLSYRGKEGCQDVRCTRLPDRPGTCYGWHCPYCHEPTSMYGHDCPQEADRG